jgi:hypothetical protein
MSATDHVSICNDVSAGSMITPEPILCCFPRIRLVLPGLPSTGPYQHLTTLGVTRFTSARTA